MFSSFENSYSVFVNDIAKSTLPTHCYAIKMTWIVEVISLVMVHNIFICRIKEMILMQGRSVVVEYIHL